MHPSLNDIASSLDYAAHSLQTISPISHTQKICLADAYKIQAISLNRRYDRSEKPTGFKLGFTSRSKMEQMGVNEVIWGRLTHKMEVSNGGTIQKNRFIHPKTEPEIAFRVSRRIERKIALHEVLNFIDGIAGALEITDSRYNSKYSLEDIVADNCFSSGYVLGKWQLPNIPIQNLKISLNINSQVVQTGNSNAILGNPLASLVEISKMMVQYNETIEAGSVILAGAATASVPIHTGDKIVAKFEGLGTVSFNV